MNDFRHRPAKSTVMGRTEAPGNRLWNDEPAIYAHRLLTYQNRTLDREIAVPISATMACITGIGPIIASDDGYIRLFDLELEKVHWTYRLKSSIYASVVVDRKRNCLYVGATDGTLTAISIKGQLIWEKKLGFGIYATPALSACGSVLFVPTFGSRCAGVRCSDGSLAFLREVTKPWDSIFDGPGSFRDVYASPVICPEGAFVLAGETAILMDSTGETIWAKNLGTKLKASPVYVSETHEVVIADSSGRVHFIDAERGTQVAIQQLDSKVTGSLAISDDVVGVGVVSGRLYGFSAVTRTRIWEREDGGPRSYTSLTTSPDGQFLAANHRGNIQCTNAKSGSFLWESSQVLGLPDHDPTIDITPLATPDGYLFCAGYSGSLYSFSFRNDGNNYGN